MEQNVNLKTPDASEFVSSPLRNRIKLELNAPISEVWALVGDPARMPEYSEGLQKVETKIDDEGKCTAYTCFFKPIEPGGQITTHNVKVDWYEPGRGWASMDEEPNAFGLQQSLTLISLEAIDDKTILNWDTHFNSENEEMVKMNVSIFAQALNEDIRQNLIKKFGGRVLENYVEVKN